MGGAQQSRMPAHAHVLTASECNRAFALFDGDDTGLMEFNEMQDAFNTMMAPATVDISAFEGTTFTPNKFRDMVEAVARQFPQYEVIWNLKRYVAENMAEGDDGVDLTDIGLTKVFTAYDADGGGHLDVGEIMKMFSFLKIPLKILVEGLSDEAFEDEKVTLEEFMGLMRKLDQNNPWAEIDEKISTLAGGLGEGAPDISEQNVDPDADANAEEGDQPEGNKKALLVGINYIGSNCELGGCINDVRNEKDMLMNNFGFPEDNILMLTEDQDDDSKLPTAQNIRDGFTWLLDGAAEGDFLFFAYSGHGSQMPNKDGTEPDGKNEILCPLDLQDNWYENSIHDDYLNDIFFDQLPDGVRCVIMYDCCHSGSMTDLGVTRDIGPPPSDDFEIKDRFLDPPDDIKEAITEAKDAACGARDISAMQGGRDFSAKQLWTISGCQDHQTSADATIGGQRQGAMTWSLIESLSEGGFAGPWTYKYENLVNTMRRKLKQKSFSQVPALCSTHVELLERPYLDQKVSP